MKFKIDKPLVIVKTHTTGLDPRADRVVAITITRYEPDGRKKSGTRMVNPECHIPQEATAIHGITNDMVEREKVFGDMAQGLFDFIKDADIAGFNIRFDIEMLMGEFARVNLDYAVYNRRVIDLYEVYLKLNPRSFSSAIAQYVDPKFEEGKVIGTDAYVGLCDELMDSMLTANTPGASLQEGVDKVGISTRVLDVRGFFAADEGNRAIFNIGKHKGKLVAEVLLSDSGYYDWMRSDKAGLPKDVLQLAEKILKKAKDMKAQKA